MYFDNLRRGWRRLRLENDASRVISNCDYANATQFNGWGGTQLQGNHAHQLIPARLATVITATLTSTMDGDGRPLLASHANH